MSKAKQVVAEQPDPINLRPDPDVALATTLVAPFIEAIRHRIQPDQIELVLGLAIRGATIGLRSLGGQAGANAGMGEWLHELARQDDRVRSEVRGVVVAVIEAQTRERLRWIDQ